MSGYGEIKIGDELFKFKFGLNAYQLFCTHRGILLSELGSALSETMAVLELAYFAHVTEVRLRNKEPYMNLTQFTEAVNDSDTLTFMTQLNEIMSTSRFLGKTVEEWAGEKKL